MLELHHTGEVRLFIFRWHYFTHPLGCYYFTQYCYFSCISMFQWELISTRLGIPQHSTSTSASVVKVSGKGSVWLSGNVQQASSLIKLPVFETKCKAMMGICIYWISRHVIFGKRCKTVPWGVGNILQSLNAWCPLSIAWLVYTTPLVDSNRSGVNIAANYVKNLLL